MVINKFKSVLLLSVIVIATFGRTGITGSGLLHKDDNVSVKSTETEGLVDSQNRFKKCYPPCY